MGVLLSRRVAQSLPQSYADFTRRHHPGKKEKGGRADPEFQQFLRSLSSIIVQSVK